MMNMMQIMNNPMLKQLMNSKNPQQMALNMMRQSPNANTPVGKNIIGMLEKGDMNGLENYARNIAQSQGLDVGQLQNMMNSIR